MMDKVIDEEDKKFLQEPPCPFCGHKMSDHEEYGDVTELDGYPSRWLVCSDSDPTPRRLGLRSSYSQQLACGLLVYHGNPRSARQSVRFSIRLFVLFVIVR